MMPAGAPWSEVISRLVHFHCPFLYLLTSIRLLDSIASVVCSVISFTERAEEGAKGGKKKKGDDGFPISSPPVPALILPTYPSYLTLHVHLYPAISYS